MRLSTKVAYNTLIQIASKFLATLLGLAAIAIITRHLGQTGFGQYTTIITFLSFFAIIADLGLTLITVQMISQPGINQDKIIGNLFALRFISALIIVGLAPLTIIFFPYEPIVKLGAAAIALSFFFIALNQVFVGIFQKNLRMDKVSIAEVVSRVILVISVIFVIKMNFGLIGILLATVFSSFIGFLMHFIFSTKFVKIKLRFDREIWVDIVKKSWPLAVAIIFNLIYLKTDTLILSLLKSQAEVGIYGAAYKVVDVLITIPFMFAGIILPIITLSWAEKNLERFKRIFQKSFDVMMIIAAPLLVGTQFIAEKIMVLVAGEEFRPSGAALKILVMAAFLIFFSSMFSHGIIAINKQKKIIWAYVFTGITAVAGYLFFIPRYSYFGAAWVTIYSELAIAVFSMLMIKKYADFFPNFKIFFKAFTASALMGIGIYSLQKIFGQDLNLLIILISAAATYSLLIWLLGGVSRQDMLDLINK